MTDQDKELLAARLKRITSDEHLLKVIEQYAKKWHELNRRRRGTTAASEFRKDVDTGRQIGYVEVISSLLGVSYGNVRDMLQNDQL